MTRKIILMTVSALMLSNSCFSQQKFPTWMDEVNFRDKAQQNQGFNEPAAPIDPSTGQPSPVSRPPGSAFGKPALPDFAKMREKAVKAELEKRLAADGELEDSYSASISNLDQLKESKAKLETLLGANPPENERNMLLSGIGELSKKLALSEEFIKLLGQDSNQAGQRTPVASLTSTQFNRAIEIQKLLFPGHSRSGKPGTLMPDKRVVIQPASATIESEDHDREPTDEELIRARTYRPGKIKSFYLESKKEKQQQEADEK